MMPATSLWPMDSLDFAEEEAGLGPLDLTDIDPILHERFADLVEERLGDNQPFIIVQTSTMLPGVGFYRRS